MLFISSSAATAAGLVEQKKLAPYKRTEEKPAMTRGNNRKNNITADAHTRKMEITAGKLLTIFGINGKDGLNGD